METRTFKLPVFLQTADGKTDYRINIPNFWESGVDARFSICFSKEDSVFYNQDIEGCLLFQEYWIGKDKFYFDLNENGELSVVCPQGWDVSINDDGTLLVYPEGTEIHEGISVWAIGDDFIVS